MLPVSIPLTVFLNSRVHDRDHLFHRLSELNALPLEWSVDSCNHVLSRSLCSNNRVDVIVNRDCHWSIEVNGHRLDTTMCQPRLCNVDVIASVAALLKIILAFEKICVCEGNPDEKFFALRDQQEGTFVDKTGKMPFGHCYSCLLLTLCL